MSFVCSFGSLRGLHGLLGRCNALKYLLFPEVVVLRHIVIAVVVARDRHLLLLDCDARLALVVLFQHVLWLVVNSLYQLQGAPDWDQRLVLTPGGFLFLYHRYLNTVLYHCVVQNRAS